MHPATSGPTIPTITVRRTGFCHAPSGPFDLERLPGRGGERWNDAGAVTAYLALRPSVLLAEWARHLDPGGLPPDTQCWSVDVRLEDVVDLRDASIRGALGLPVDLAWVLDTAQTRDVAATLRYLHRVSGLIVPSAAFLDQPHLGSVVAFLDREADIRDVVVGQPRRVGGWGSRPGDARMDQLGRSRSRSAVSSSPA